MRSPRPPDPYQTANAQAGANRDASIAGSLVNNVNTYTPFGSVEYTSGESRYYTDAQGNRIEVPTTVRTETLSPEQQQLLDLQNQASTNMGTLAVNQSGMLNDYLGRPFQADPNTPLMPNSVNLQRTIDINGTGTGGGSLGYAPTGYPQLPITSGQPVPPVQPTVDPVTPADPTVPQPPVAPPVSPPDQPPITPPTTGGDQLVFRSRGTGEKNTGPQINPGLLSEQVSNQPAVGRPDNRLTIDPVTGDVTASPFADPATPKPAGTPPGGIDAPRGLDGRGIQRSIGPSDYSEDRIRVEDALMGRFSRNFNRQRDAAESRLRNQGLMPGSEAYNNQMDLLGQQYNDAAMQAILAGGSEQSRLQNMELRQGGFNNQAQNQAFGQGLTEAQFGNQSLLQELGAMGNLRGQSLQEQLSLRNQPLNEIAALLSGNQLNVPQFQGSYQQAIGAAPIGGYIYNNYNQRSRNANAFNGGLFDLGAAFIGG